MSGMEIGKKRAALSLGLLFAVLYIIGIALVVATNGGIVGLEQSMYFLTMGAASVMLPFNVLTFIMGVVVAFIAGAVTGWLFAWIWSMLKE